MALPASRAGVDDLTLGGSVGGHQVGLEPDRRDVGDAGPAQPVVEVGLLKVAPECRPAVGAPHGARVHDGGLPPGQEARVAALGVEAEHHARLGDDVDELLEDVRNARVPHRHAEQVLVGSGEPAERPLRLVPGGGLRTSRSGSGEDRHLRAGCGRPERGQRAVPQVERVDLGVGVGLPVAVEEHAGDRQRLRGSAAR